VSTQRKNIGKKAFYALQNEKESEVSKAAKKIAHFTRVALEDFLVFSCGGFSHLVKMRKFFPPVRPQGVQWGGGGCMGCGL
jgi:hypothetical protein